jgi:large subunit ribosomal protein L15
LGRTCGRGEKGQKSRSGSTIRPHFEGGQIPLFRRIPKRGFNHPSHKEYNLVNVSTLEKFFEAGDEIDAEVLPSKGVIRKNDLPLKVLANGVVEKAFKVKASKFSKVAREKIEAAGGTCETV